MRAGEVSANSVEPQPSRSAQSLIQLRAGVWPPLLSARCNWGLARARAIGYNADVPLNLDEIRRNILIALVSDDVLLDTLVLKGGNALAMVHEVGERTSADLDYSIAANFPDEHRAKTTIFELLRRQFLPLGYVLVDERFIPKPSRPSPGKPEGWGGFVIEFKLVEKAIFEKYGEDLEALRRNAAVLGPQQKKIFTIDVSKNEYCAGKVRREIDGYSIYVYSLEMIALEKLRAICQQMPDYALTTTNKSSRSRDFYDIHAIASRTDVDLQSGPSREMLAHIFAAKAVPLELLGEIHRFREFHEPDWASVVASVSGPLEPFEYYFDFVVALAAQLKPSG